MQAKPWVSIVIPAYNMERYVKEAVDSALAQHYRPLEVIVVDDGSTDGTKRVLEPYIKSGSITYIYQKNKGLAGARNTGLRAAQGSYIALLDADDIFLPEKVGLQVDALEAHPDYGVCYSDIIHFSDTEPRVYYHHRYRYPSGDILEPLLHKQFVNPLAVLFRRDVFDRCGYFDETLRRSEDWEFWLRIAKRGVKFYYFDKPLAQYRIRGEGNLSSLASEPEMKVKNLAIFTRFGENLTETERRRYRFADVLASLRMKTAYAYLLVGKKADAMPYLAEAPFWMRWAVRAAPAGAWRRVLAFARRMKHRSLLKRVG